MALPQEFLAELKYKNDVESVLSPYIVLKRRGSNLVGLCPFHNEKTPSFTVYPENGSYYCFGCGKGGDIITFTMQIENLDYIDAVRKLAERAGLKMPENDADNKEEKLRSDIYEVNREAARFFHSYMMTPKGKAGLDYFLSRGLSPATIKHFGLGFAPDSWHDLEDHLKKKGFSDYVIRRADLVGRSTKPDKNGAEREFTYDRFRNRCIFPIINVHGKVIGFSGRAMPGNEKQGGKYVNTSDTPVYKKSHNMYGLNFAKKTCSESVILVEGNLDVIALHQAGFENTVAALGTSFTEEQARLLGRYTKEVYVTMDADEAGEKSTDRTLKILSSVGVKVKVVRMTGAKDPDEFIKKFGAERFRNLLDKAFSDIEYRLLTAARGVDLTADDGRWQYLKKACAVLSEVGDPIAAEVFAGKLSKKYGVSKEVLMNNIREITASKKKQAEKKQLDNIVTNVPKKDEVNPQKQQFKRAAVAEETLICAIIKHPDLLGFVKENISVTDMLTDFSKKLYQRVVDILETGREFDLVFLGDSFSPDEIGYVMGLLTTGIDDTNAERSVKDSIKVIFEEKNALEQKGIEMLPDDEWAKALKKLKGNN